MTLAVEELAWSETEVPAPRHIAIIMDGNGRWAAERGLPRAEGHRQGVDSVRRTVKAALELGITHLTLFSFSSENWSRPQQEIHDLFGLMRRFVRRDLADLHKNGVKIRVIGTRAGLDDDILRLIDDAVLLTKDNSALNLTIAFNYGARDEIARAASRIAEDVAKGLLAPAEVTQERFATYLDTADLPDPDLLIR
ncbi:MAG TPA: polyprenyl diphosphate synthase, partial [Methyloceanibacter sp.]|nr:polyprenyl diphosphate synthase [Methyloceanibacter sp.]